MTKQAGDPCHKCGASLRETVKDRTRTCSCPSCGLVLWVKAEKQATRQDFAALHEFYRG